MTLTAVFGTAFLAATILPFSSEVVVAAALADDTIGRVALWTVATAGNTLGAAVNWGLGRYATQFRDRQWFPASQGQMDKAEAWFNRYGVWSLLMAWLPLGERPLRGPTWCGDQTRYLVPCPATWSQIRSTLCFFLFWYLLCCVLSSIGVARTIHL